MNKKDFWIKVLVNGVPFGMIMGILHGGKYGLLGGVIYGAIIGLLFGSAMSVFFSRMVKKVDKEMRSPDGTYDGEIIALEGPANHFLRFEGRGGWLTLTDGRLIFRSHGKNIQNRTLVVPISSIRSVQKKSTANVVDNGLLVELVDGKKESFVVTERDLWLKKIREIINA